MVITDKLNLVSSSDKKETTVMRRQIYGKNIYELSMESLLLCVDTISRGNVLNHVGCVMFESIGNFGVDGAETFDKIAEYLAMHMSDEEKKDLFGSDINLKNKDCFITYFSMCPSYSNSIMGQETIKFIKANYEFEDGKLMRRKLLRR